METLKLEIGQTGAELTVRQGAATVLRDPVPVVLQGTITAPADFFSNRLAFLGSEAAVEAAGENDVAVGPEAMKARCHVVANYTSRTIKLRWDEANTFASEITGALKLHPALEGLNINSERTYDEKGLLALIKFNRAYFDDRTKYDQLRTSLMNFNAKVSQQFKNENDYQGAEAQQKLTNVTHNVPLKHALAVPVFAGTEASKFDIDICLGLKGNTIIFWIESVDLKEQIVILTESLFEDELKRFDGVVVVKQY